MTTHEMNDDRSPAGQHGFNRLVPIAGFSVVLAVVLAHLAGGLALMDLDPGAVLGTLGFGGNALAVGLAAVIAIKLLIVFAARRRMRRR